MTRRLLLAPVVLLLLLPGIAHARVKLIRAGACNVLTDGIGDVQVNDLAGTEATGDTHLDVDSVYVYHHGKSVDVTIYDEALSANRRGTWTVTFIVGKTTYAVRASAGSWSAANATETFTAGTVGHLVPVKGDIDVATSTVTITAPYTVFGAAGRKGTKWGRFTVDAEEVFAGLPTGAAGVRLHDAGTSTKTYRAGATCPVPFGPPPPPPPGRSAA